MSFDDNEDSLSFVSSLKPLEEEHNNNPHHHHRLPNIIERSDPSSQTCTLKSGAKGCVYTDPHTKQRRFLSPLE